MKSSMATNMIPRGFALWVLIILGTAEMVINLTETVPGAALLTYAHQQQFDIHLKQLTECIQ